MKLGSRNQCFVTKIIIECKLRNHQQRVEVACLILSNTRDFLFSFKFVSICLKRERSLSLSMSTLSLLSRQIHNY